MPIHFEAANPLAMILAAPGLAAQEAPRRRLKIRKAVEVRDGSKLARLSPGAGFELRVAIEFPSKAIGRQTITFTMSPGAFARDVAWARTFGFMKDVEAMRSGGKALGGSLDNAIVVDGDAILNPGGLKAPDEFVRHKLLDVIGDLFLAGGPIEGLYEGEQPGHALNNRLLRAVLADASTHAWVQLPAA
jgi:UDP-3-O-[3-hydroxymyristoyl] N-acetylglucosamine deacetylase